MGVAWGGISGLAVTREEAWILHCVRDDDGGGGWAAVFGVGCGAGGGVRVGSDGGRGASGGRGEVAGLPEAEDLFEAGEDAREDGGDQGCDQGFWGFGRTSPTRPRGGDGSAEAGEVVGQPGCLGIHSWVIYLIHTGGERFFIFTVWAVW